MKWMYFFPLTFFSGIEGFGLFAVYLAVVMSLYMVMKKVRTAPRLDESAELAEVPVTA